MLVLLDKPFGFPHILAINISLFAQYARLLMTSTLDVHSPDYMNTVMRSTTSDPFTLCGISLLDLSQTQSIRLLRRGRPAL